MVKLIKRYGVLVLFLGLCVSCFVAWYRVVKLREPVPDAIPANAVLYTNDGLSGTMVTNIVGSTNSGTPNFSPYERAIIVGMSNGTYGAMVTYNREHGNSNNPPALTYDPRNPIGSFTHQYIEFLMGAKP